MKKMPTGCIPAPISTLVHTKVTPQTATTARARRWYRSSPVFKVYFVAMHSISTKAPLGRVFTATALRAGKGWEKNWA